MELLIIIYLSFLALFIFMLYINKYISYKLPDDNRFKLWWRRNIIDKDPYDYN